MSRMRTGAGSPRSTRFRQADEMCTLFADLPDAVDNTVVVARRCAVMAPVRSRFCRPSPLRATRAKPMPCGPRPRKDWSVAWEAQVYGSDMDADTREAAAAPYRERLAYELGVIIEMQFAGYFLIVADIVRWARGRRDPGRPRPGVWRGLRGGLVAHHHRSGSAPIRPVVRALSQSRTGVDAGLRHRLLPRAPRRRHRGTFAGATAKDRVAQIITFGKLQARAVLRDVGRVCSASATAASTRLCKLVSVQPGQPGDPAAGAGCRAQAQGRAPTTMRRFCAPDRDIAPARRAFTATPRPTPPAS